jgi:poly(A) polymerase
MVGRGVRQVFWSFAPVAAVIRGDVMVVGGEVGGAQAAGGRRTFPPVSEAQSPREIDPVLAREFARQIVQRLRTAGFESLWAGGCVRDYLLKIEPKDYDVATNATPQQIRELFGHRRTLAVGAAFGVIAVLGPRHAGQVEVATFRSDAQYSDGRHPDQVTFSTAEFDAQRRDFTINGLFFDPLEDRVIDYVDGLSDLQRGIVRAIGDPYARIAEDKLRMLRAVRIASTFGFELHAATFHAVQRQAHELVIVSAERITAELRRMLTDRHRARAASLLRETGLLDVLLPESSKWYPAADWNDGQASWIVTQRVLQQLHEPSFAASFATLLRAGVNRDEHPGEMLRRVCQRLRLTNAETAAIEFLLLHEPMILAARQIAWPTLQRVLIDPRAGDLLNYSRAIATVLGRSLDDIDFCAAKLALPIEQLNPPPLITGAALKAAGMRPGPVFARMLHEVRDAQLLGEITTPAAALALAERLRSEYDAERGE